MFEHWRSNTFVGKSGQNQIKTGYMLPKLNPELKLFYSLRLLLNIYLTCCQRLWSYEHMAVYKLKGAAEEPNKFHNYETEKITRKASDVAEYIDLFGSSTRDRYHARRI